MSESDNNSQPPGADLDDETSIFAFCLRYGVIGGVIVSVLSLVFFLVGMADHWSNALVGVLVLVGTMIWAQLSYRSSEQPPVDYGEALGVAVVTTLYLSIVGAIYTVIYMTVIDPGVVERSIDVAAAQMREMGMTEEQIESQLSMSRAMSGPLVSPLLSIVGNVILGTLIGLISSIFMRKKLES